MSPATVSLENVSKSYDEGNGRRQVLKNLDLEVQSGETVALLGSSGSGKSTLLNIIAGLTVPDSGEVTVAGTALTSKTENERTLFRRRSVGFIFQFFHLVPTLTVLENLRLSLQLNEMDTPSERHRLEELLERVKLIDRANQLPDRLSGGEQQRVAVCRAVAHRPALLLADEPTGNLDTETADGVLDLIFDLSQGSQTTVMIVTHSSTVAARCQRVERVVDGILRSETP